MLEQRVRAADVFDDDGAVSGRDGLEDDARRAFDTTADEKAVELATLEGCARLVIGEARTTTQPWAESIAVTRSMTPGVRAPGRQAE